MNPEIWGHHGWIFLHSITLVYPDTPTKEDKENVINFFMNTGNVLPCYKCRNNYKKHLVKYPMNDTILKNRENLVKWLINIHNEVNISQDKPILNYEDVVKSFIHNKNDKLFEMYNLIIISLLIVLLIILTVVFMKLIK
jgi:hypothetical protein